MANEEHLAILRKGVEIWNNWRDETFFDAIQPDLSGANLSEAALHKANLEGANLCGTIFYKADLSNADLCSADLSEANLREADVCEAILSEAILQTADLRGAKLDETDLAGAVLNGADLRVADLRAADLSWARLIGARLDEVDLTGSLLDRADLSGSSIIGATLSKAKFRNADLHGANLSGAVLNEANLSQADLSDVDLSAAYLRQTELAEAHLSGAYLGRAFLGNANLISANLQRANLSRADLTDAELQEATIGWTTFRDVDLSVVRGLDAVIHEAPSSIDIDTVYRSKGNIPEAFLRGAGVPDSMIEFMHSLVRSERAIDFYSCFVSYSSKDQPFAERLYADLQNKGVRCWFAPEDMKIGAKIRPALDQSIRVHDKLLLILSEHSVASDWVEQEVETALARERQEGRTVLFPIRLDDTVMEIDVGWPALIRNTRHIGDFRNWKDRDAYKRAFGRLLRDLKAG